MTLLFSSHVSSRGKLPWSKLLLVSFAASLSMIVWAHEKQPNTKERIAKQLAAAKSPALTPEEQLKTFTLPEGFSIELVTSEVQGAIKPVSMNFDDAGRLWMTTAQFYPIDTERKRNSAAHVAKAEKIWSSPGADKVLVIDKPWQPGPHKPRVFLDGLVIPMSVLPYKNGAYVLQGPEFFYSEDTDGDGRGDKKTLLLKGLGVQDSHTMAHNLMHIPGNKIFFCQGGLVRGEVTDPDGRKFPLNGARHVILNQDGRQLRIKSAGLPNAWGWQLDAEGQWWAQGANNFGNAVTPVFEGSHFPWNGYLPYAYQPGTNNALNLRSTGLSGLAQSEDRVGGFPAEWQKVRLIADPILNRILTLDVQRRDDGTFQVARGKDLLTTTDPRFRPVAMQIGPDGALYVLDWYNPVIAHNELDREHEARDKYRGRIWRISHRGQQRVVPNVQAAPTFKLIMHLQSGNLWQRRAAWHQIAERKAVELLPQLKAIAAQNKAEDSLRIHALWAIESLQHFDPALWQKLLQDSNPHVRYQAVRSLRHVAPDIGKVRSMLRPLARDLDYRVRYQAIVYHQFAKGITFDDFDWLQVNLRCAQPAEALKTDRSWSQKAFPWGGPYEAAHQNDLLNTALKVIEKQLDVVPFLARFSANDLDTNLTALRVALTRGQTVPAARKLLSGYLATAEKETFLRRIERLENQSEYNPVKLATLLPKVFSRQIKSLLMSDKEELVRQGLRLLALSRHQPSYPFVVKRMAAIQQKFPKLSPYMLRCLVTAKVPAPQLYRRLAGDKKQPWEVRTIVLASQLQKKEEIAQWLIGQKLNQDQLTLIYNELARTAEGRQFIASSFTHGLAGLSIASEMVATLYTGKDAEKYPRLKELELAVYKQQRAQWKQDDVEIAKVQQAIEKLGEVSPEQGKTIFKALCMTCHDVGGKGAGFGPALDGAGQLSPQAVLRTLHSPNRDVERNYATYLVQLLDGRVFKGILLDRRHGKLTLGYPGGQRQQFFTQDIVRQGYIPNQSLMPRLNSLDTATKASLIQYLQHLSK